MSTRSLLHAALTTDTFLLARIPVDRWIQQGAVDEALDRPFAVVGWSDSPRSDLGSSQPRLTIWIHDDRGSYKKIDEIIGYLEGALPSKVPLEDSTSRVVDVRWDGSSGDLTDEGYSTNVRNCNFTLTGRK